MYWNPRDAWSSRPQLAPSNLLGSSCQSDPFPHPVSTPTHLGGRYLLVKLCLPGNHYLLSVHSHLELVLKSVGEPTLSFDKQVGFPECEKT